MSELALVEERAVSDRNEEQLVTMSVDGQLFGLPILSVQDIVETHNITQVPRTPSAISGIMNLRGRIVTVINLKRILGRNDETASRMGVTVEFHGDLYTILVDEIGEVRLLDRSDFEAAPATLDAKLKQLCTGIYRLDGELLAVLDVNQILSAETIAQTPPIRFVARRPKEVKENGKPAAKALPAPANDAAEEEKPEPAHEDETAKAKPKAKQGKNIFRKQKVDAGAKPAEKKAVEHEEPEPEKDAAPESEAPEKPKAVSAEPAKVEAAPTPDADAAEDRPTVNATDVAPGAPTPPPSRSENLLELVGGESGLGKIVAGFYDQAKEDKQLASHFEGANLQSQAQAMQTFLCSALKGDGKSVQASGHNWLSPEKGLNDEDFNKCLALFEKAMHDHSVPDGTIFRVLAVFERQRESIVD